MSRKCKSGKKNSKRDKEEKSYDEEAGIPTTFTPVPSEASSFIRNQTLRQLPKNPFSSQFLSKKLEKIAKIDNSNNNQEKINDEHLSIFLRMHFMQKLHMAFEIGRNRTIKQPIQFVLADIAQQIKTKFDFYVYVSACEIIWNRTPCKLMKTAASPSVFRHLIKPSQMNMSLMDLIAEIDAKNMGTLNFYIFVKKWQDEETDAEEDGEKEQKMDQVWNFELGE